MAPHDSIIDTVLDTGWPNRQEEGYVEKKIGKEQLKRHESESDFASVWNMERLKLCGEGGADFESRATTGWRGIWICLLSLYLNADACTHRKKSLDAIFSVAIMRTGRSQMFGKNGI